MKKSSFNKQFKPGTYPIEHWDESTRVNGHEQDPPSKVRKRQGVSLGNQTQANPGLNARNDDIRKRKK